MGEGVGEVGAPAGLVHVPTPAVPEGGAGIEGVGVGVRQAQVVAGMEGGSPLWIDRLIVVCMMGLLALVVRKFA